MKFIKSLLLVAAICLFVPVMANAQTSIPVKPPVKNQTLDSARRIIDSLDNAVLHTLGEREKIVKEIGIYKAKNHIAPLQAARFQQVLDKSIAEGKKLGLSAEFITQLMNAVHEESLRIERDSTIVGN
jgi:chorismate mutase